MAQEYYYTSRNNSSLNGFRNDFHNDDDINDKLGRLEQAGRVPSKDKFRRMACSTWIYSGSCPYGDKCTFIHDTALHSSHFQARPLKSNMKHPAMVRDTFYWPDMNKYEVRKCIDSSGLPNSNQSYSIPSAFSLKDAIFHNRAIYSLWNHFISMFAVDHHLQISDLQRLLSVSPAPGGAPTSLDSIRQSSSTPYAPPASRTSLGSLCSTSTLSLPSTTPLPARSRLNDCLSPANHHVSHMKRLPVLVMLSSGLSPQEAGFIAQEHKHIKDLCDLLCGAHDKTFAFAQ